MSAIATGLPRVTSIRWMRIRPSRGRPVKMIERPSGIHLDRQEPPALEGAPGELRSELAACLGPLIERLPPLHREALALTELEGLTQTSAAARLGLSSSGMKSRVQRGRAQLKELLGACCEIELDRRGGVRSYRPLRGPCDCGTGAPARPKR